MGVAPQAGLVLGSGHRTGHGKALLEAYWLQTDHGQVDQCRGFQAETTHPAGPEVASWRKGLSRLG